MSIIGIIAHTALSICIMIIIFAIILLIYDKIKYKYVEYDDDVQIIRSYKPGEGGFNDYAVIVKYKYCNYNDIIFGKDNYLQAKICNHNGSMLAHIRRLQYPNGKIFYMVDSFSNINVNKLMKNKEE